MDLTVVYSKTAKGMRARSSLIGGLSSQLMKVLLHVDGASKAETILFKYDEMTEQGLAAALIQLETEGYIKPVLSTRPSADEWSPATIFAPMEVEEVVSVEDAEAQAAEQARLQAEYKAKIKEEVRLQAERKAQEKEEQEYAKEKVKAEAKVKAQLEVERITREAEETQKKAEEEALAKAEEKAKLEAERKVKLEQEARQKAELKAQEAAERKVKAEEEARISAELAAREEAEKARVNAEAELKAHREAELSAQQEEENRKLSEAEASARAEEAKVKAQAEAKENARLEAERIARDAKEAQKKSEVEASAKAEEEARLEAECAAKAEADAKLEAERVAKADEDTRLEAERKAIKEEEARLKAESKAKAEAEKIRAKAEAEEKIKAEEKERARLDIARIVREAEEARKKSEAEAKETRLIAKQKEKAAEEQKKAEIEANAKTKLANKLEAERKNKSEEDARLKAEIKAKAQADQSRTDAEAKEKASVDANLKASLAMQSFVTDAEEAQLESGHETNAATSLKAEFKAELKAEQVRAKIEADEKALAQEKEIARQEMERIGREAELERKKQHPEASTAAPFAATADAGAIEVRWANPDEDDDDEDFEEERIAGEVEKVGLEIKKKTKRVAEVEGRQEIIRVAKEEAEVKAKSKVQSRTLAITKILGNCAAAAKKAMLIYLPLVILLIIGLLHLVNIRPLIAPIEKLASESLGTPVLIKEVRASLWPRPHLVLRNVALGANTSQKIETVNIVPDTSSLSEEVKVLRSIKLEGLKIEQENFGQPVQWLSNLSKAQHLLVKQIALKKIVLKIHDLELAPFDGKVTLTDSRELKSIDLMTDDETLAMQITPQGSGFDIAFTGTNWALPMNPKFVFSELKAKGTIKQSLLFFNQIEGAIYGGSFTGKAALDWSNQWSIAGNFNLINANLPEILNAFGSSASVDGKFNLAGIFACKSKLAAALTDAPEITANFTVQNGKINGVELGRAVLSKSSQSLAGDSTRFDKLTGSVKIKNESYHYRQLVLKSDQFYAEGNVDIQPNQDISGKINANLAAQSRRLQASFNLAGKVNNVKRQ